MERLTRVLENSSSYFVDDTKIRHDISGYSGEAVMKLAKFENMYESLVEKQNQIVKEMEKLKSEGKTNSVRFKQLLVNKITNKDMIALFETYGL